MALIEKGPGYRSGLRDFFKHLNLGNFSAGIIASIMGCTSGALIIIGAAQQAGLPQTIVESWLFSVFFFGGLITLFMAPYYKQSICGAWSIPGAALVAISAKNFVFNEVVFAYILAGVLVLFIGLTGLVRKVMIWIPRPIVMGMVAGALFKFGIEIFPATIDLPVIAIPMITVWAVFTMFRAKLKIPGILVSLIVGIIIAAGKGMTDFSSITLDLAHPIVFMPSFNAGVILSLSVPLAILVITAENTQAMGILMTEGFNPPVNSMTIISGIGGIITAIFGGHNANIAGPMTAITSSPEAGPVEWRYIGSTINGILFGGFGIIAGAALSFVSILPKPLLVIAVGLTMVGVLTSALVDAWSGKFEFGAFFSFFFTASMSVWFHIGSPFWGLLFGTILSYFLDRKDWKERRNK